MGSGGGIEGLGSEELERGVGLGSGVLGRRGWGRRGLGLGRLGSEGVGVGGLGSGVGVGSVGIGGVRLGIWWGLGLEGCFYGELCYYLRIMNFRKKFLFCFFHAILPDKSKQVCF